MSRLALTLPRASSVVVETGEMPSLIDQVPVGITGTIVKLHDHPLAVDCCEQEIEVAVVTRHLDGVVIDAEHPEPAWVRTIRYLLEAREEPAQ